jgi:cobalt-zinc-cadmium efflux system protein
MGRRSFVGGGHHHGGTGSAAQQHRGRLLVALGISLTVLVGEVVGALLTGSLALLADAGHVLTDAVGVGLALLAVWFAARPANARRTFGYYRMEILTAVANAVILLGVALFVLVEAVRRIGDPPEVRAGPMLVVALLGLVANLVGLLVLRRGQGESLLVRGAYLEVLGDLLGSAAVVVAALVIRFTGWQLADPVASALIGLLILPRTVALLRDAVNVLLEATPAGIDTDRVRAHMLRVPGVADVHDLHVWTITSGMPAMSAHVVIEDPGTPDGGPVLDALGGCLGDHFDVRHCTFQLEPRGHAAHEPTTPHA